MIRNVPHSTATVHVMRLTDQINLWIHLSYLLIQRNQKYCQIPRPRFSFEWSKFPRLAYRKNSRCIKYYKSVVFQASLGNNRLCKASREGREVIIEASLQLLSLWTC